jgi:tripartite ATP-independent transporter DctP family solute receptor
MKVDRRQFLQGTAAATAAAVCPRYAKAAEFEYKLGNNQTANHPSTLRSIEAADRIFKATDGRLKISVFPTSQLGSDTDCLSQVRSGALEIFQLSPVIMATLLPVAAISGICFAFKDYKTVWSALDGDLGKLVRGEIAKVGLVASDRIFDNGFRVITTSTHQINTPDDLKGVKMRVPASPLWTSMFKALGAAPATVNWSEAYSALQTKIVDGQENPLNLIEIFKINEVQKYVSVTNHMWDGFWPLFNAKALKALPPKFQDIVLENFTQAGVEQRADVDKLNQTAGDNLKKLGMVFAYPDPEAFRTVLRQVGWYKEWKERLGAQAWATLEKYAGQLG